MNLKLFLILLAIASLTPAEDETKEVVPNEAERSAQQDISHRLAKLKEEYAEKENVLVLETEIVRLNMCLRAGVPRDRCGAWTPQGTVVILPPKAAPAKPEAK